MLFFNNTRFIFHSRPHGISLVNFFILGIWKFTYHQVVFKLTTFKWMESISKNRRKWAEKLRSIRFSHFCAPRNFCNWFYSLVGYDASFTRMRSPVRTRVESVSFCSLFRHLFRIQKRIYLILSSVTALSSRSSASLLECNHFWLVKLTIYMHQYVCSQWIVKIF